MLGRNCLREEKLQESYEAESFQKWQVFCSKSCQTKWRNSEFSAVWHRFWKDGSSTYRDVIIKSGIVQECALCHLGDKRVLAVHHKDQNRKNYNLDNLLWLCHNCHHRIHHGAIDLD